MTKMVWLALLCYHPAPFADTSSEDSYALYSSIYRDSQSLEADEIIGIAAKPLAIRLYEGCVKPVTAEEREMVEAARAASNVQTEWEARFDLGRPYRLIPSTETDKAIDCVQDMRMKKGPSGCEAYVKMRYIRFFSVPVFNRDHTRALIAISRSCGGLCGNGGLLVYRKTRAGWEREPDSFATCAWEA